MTSIAVLHSSPLHRAALAALLQALGLEVVAASDLSGLTGDDVSAEPPELVLVELPPSPSDIADLMDQIRAKSFQSRAVFLAPAFDLNALAACVSSGAAGFIVQTISREALQCSLELVKAGGMVFPSELAEVLATREGETALQPVAAMQAFPVTLREIAILQRLARGETNRDIAAAVGMSEVRLRTVLHRLRRKLRIDSRTELAVWAARHGLGTARDRR